MLICLGLVFGMMADEPSPAGVGADPPRAVPFWQLERFDRVTLSNGNRHDIDPVRIPPGTDLRAVADDEYVGQPGLPLRAELRRSVKYRIRRQADGKEYEVFGRHIDKIELYEEMLLGQARKLLRDDRFDECFRYLDHLSRISPDWPGLAEFRVEFHHREAVRLKVASQWEKAFWEFLQVEKEVASLPSEPTLSPPVDQQIDELVDRWLAGLIEKEDWGEARRVIARVESARPDTPSAMVRRQQIEKQASALRDQGLQGIEKGQFDQARKLLEDALARVPSDPQTRSSLDSLYQKQGHLRVGLEIAPSFFGGPADWTPADLRAIDLIHERLVQETIRDGEASFQSRLLPSIQRPDEFLNRRVIIRIADGRRWPDTGKDVSILDVHRLWSESCRPESPFYHPALARLVVGLTVEHPSGLVIDFERPQPRPEVWLTLPLISLNARSESNWSGLGPFAMVSKEEGQVRYQTNKDYGLAGKPIVQQVTERVIPHSPDRLRAFAHEEIDLALDLPPSYWPIAQNLPRAKLIRRQAPTVFALQFNFRQAFLRDRTVRRAIRYGLDTDTITRKLGLSKEDVVRPTTIWPVGSFGYDTSIVPAKGDLVLSKTLLSASQKKFGVIPSLRLVHTGSEADRQACEAIAQDLSRVGLRITVASFDPRSPVSPLSADLRYVGLTIKDPVFDVMTFLTRDNPTLAEFSGPWLRQLLVDLVDVPNQSAARDLLPRLHRVLFDDVSVLPLWQYHERWLVSDRVSGIPSSSENVYDGVADWQVRPGTPPAYWSAEPVTTQQP
ncbi:hypothetical protein K2X85_01050 [bacterium]|nr:hypothetical protein [bacterium]